MERVNRAVIVIGERRFNLHYSSQKFYTCVSDCPFSSEFFQCIQTTVAVTWYIYYASPDTGFRVYKINFREWLQGLAVRVGEEPESCWCRLQSVEKVVVWLYLLVWFTSSRLNSKKSAFSVDTNAPKTIHCTGTIILSDDCSCDLLLTWIREFTAMCVLFSLAAIGFENLTVTHSLTETFCKGHVSS